MSISPPSQSTIQHYQHLRKLGFELNNTRLVPKLSKRDLLQGAKDLGLLKRDTFVFDNEYETSILMDYCLLFPASKKSLIDREIEAGGHTWNSDEMRLLQTTQQAYYSVFLLEPTDAIGFCSLRDLLTGETLGLIDMGLSQYRHKINLAGNLIPILDTEYWMTTGTMIPIPTEHLLKGALRLAAKFLPAGYHQRERLNRNRQKALAKQLIRYLLRNDALSGMA